MKYKAVLFDLDGNLLPLDLESFIQDYFRALSASVAAHVEPKRFVSALLQATQVMLENDGSKTNSQVFMDSFLPLLDCKPETLMPLFERFYQEKFPDLGKDIKPLPQARQAVELAAGQGAKIVLATNPVFPRAAVDARLEWAGLGDIEFDWITSYENSCYCKPNPGYYMEILENINLKPQQCLMVGNDTREDTAAGAVGMDTFLVEGHIVEHAGAPAPTWRGSWEQLLELLQ